MVTEGEKYQVYMRGWRDGAGIKAIDRTLEQHPTLSEEYVEGYTDGQKARVTASQAAAKRLGYKPRIL